MKFNKKQRTERSKTLNLRGNLNKKNPPKTAQFFLQNCWPQIYSSTFWPQYHYVYNTYIFYSYCLWFIYRAVVSTKNLTLTYSHNLLYSYQRPFLGHDRRWVISWFCLMSVLVWIRQNQLTQRVHPYWRFYRYGDDNARHCTMYPVKWWTVTDQWIANDFHLSLLNKGKVTGANEMRENQAILNEMTSASFLSNHS